MIINKKKKNRTIQVFICNKLLTKDAPVCAEGKKLDRKPIDK